MSLVPSYQLSNAEREGDKYAASLGAESLTALRALPADKLLEGDAATVSHPIIEPYALPLSPYDAFALARQNDVPILIGSNAEEARALNVPRDITAETFNARISQNLGAPIDLIGSIATTYAHDTNSQAQTSAIELETDLRFG